MNQVFEILNNYASQDINLIYKIIASYFLNHPREAAETKIIDIAKKLNCSTGTISNFAKKISKNFKTLQYELSIIEKNTKLDISILKNDGDIYKEIILNEYCELIKNSLNFVQKNSIQAIIDSVKLFNKKNKIFLFAAGYSQSPCAILFDYLMKFGYSVYFSKNLDSQEYFLSLIDTNSLTIVFSYSLLTPKIISFCNEIQKTDCKKIIISANYKSTFFQNATQGIMIKSNEEVLKKLRNSRIQFTYISMLITLLLSHHE